MPQRPENPPHPGPVIRERVIPSGMSVTEAAKRLGVGRPALSNLLNGRSALSVEMAARLETAFGADRGELLDLQTAFDRDDPRAEERAVATVGAYVPDFLTIEGRRIAAWADGNIEARQLLPVLLRKLIHSTGRDLRRVDFPGYDNAERKGWDGWIEAGAATPWIPEGESGWEFGADKEPRRKAEHDYAARVASAPAAERAERTFVFVTPRNWPGKTEWVESKRAAGDWKEVRALDASDLEQWLEQSIPARIWLAEKLGLPTEGFQTLDACWRRWAAASDPKLTPALFAPSLAAYGDDFKKWLEKPSERPLTVAADSREEALAFLARLFREDGIAAQWGNLAAVFDSVGALRKLATSNAPFLPIVHTDAAERELASVYRERHCIAVRPRNAVDSKPDIALDLLDYIAFETALAEMGIENDDADRLARESGRSPTILRRRLSKVSAIRTPGWAADARTARSLIPMTLVGAWHATSNADREVVRYWGNGGYEQVEESIAQLLRLDDCPVWSTRQYRGVASKIDALFAIDGYMTEKDIDDLFFLAELVLSETDPALELPEDQRWAAGVYGKVRDHSAALREGICETLVVLAVHGNDRFRGRLGIDVEARVSSLIRRLLTPFTLDTLLSQDKDLPLYAEAAPEEFLNLIEADLQQSAPVVLDLLKPADSGPFGDGRPRTGLLGALQCLAWKHLGRVSPILARLSRTAIDDNLTNLFFLKPIASLAAIYRFWLPQTAASLEERIQSLETLTKRFPDVGWEICMKQLDTGSPGASPSYRPRWRGDASGAGHGATWKEIHDFQRKALDLALAWLEHDQKMLGDLVEHLQGMPDEDQAKVWNFVDAWVDEETDDSAKAELRERIRRFAFTRSGRRRKLNDATRNRARAAYEKLQPRDPVVRHAWLFADQWVYRSPDENEDDDLDYAERDRRIDSLWASAMREIWAERGFEGVMALLSGGGVPHVVGDSLGKNITDAKARVGILRQFLSIANDLENGIDGCIGGFLRSVEGEACGAALSSAAEGADADRIVRLFRCAPFGQDTWRLLDRYGEDIRARYWRTVSPSWNRHDDAELNEIVDRLLEAKRPRAAFVAVRLDWPRIETSRLKRLLFDAVDAEPKEHYRLDPYSISKALDSLDGRAGVAPDEMARLEFMYIKALDDSEHGIPNLERRIAESPVAFVQALALTRKRRDNGQDPPEWWNEDPEQRAGMASDAYSLLGQIGRTPGTGSDGRIDTEALSAWIAETRRLCTEYGWAEIGDEYIGQLLSRAPADDGGAWPCLSVCEVMERVASPEIGQGFCNGARNARGVTSRALGEGGEQERELAAKYRCRAERRAVDYPYVAGVLESIAAFYDREAAWEDDKAIVRARLGY